MEIGFDLRRCMASIGFYNVAGGRNDLRLCYRLAPGQRQSQAQLLGLAVLDA